MARDCADLNMCLVCNKPVGFKSKGCECICHNYTEWEDDYGNIHIIRLGKEEKYRVGGRLNEIRRC